jgi:hypothetical protein
MRVCGKRGWRWWKRSRCAGRRRRAREDLAARRLAPRCVPWNVVGRCGQLSCVRARPCSCTRAAARGAARHRRCTAPPAAPRQATRTRSPPAASPGSARRRPSRPLPAARWHSVRHLPAAPAAAAASASVAIEVRRRERLVCSTRRRVSCFAHDAAAEDLREPRPNLRARRLRGSEVQLGGVRRAACSRGAARAPPPPPPRSGDSDARVQQQRAGCGKHCRRTCLSQPARNAQQSPEHQGARTRQTEM